MTCHLAHAHAWRSTLLTAQTTHPGAPPPLAMPTDPVGDDCEVLVAITAGTSQSSPTSPFARGLMPAPIPIQFLDQTGRRVQAFTDDYAEPSHEQLVTAYRADGDRSPVQHPGHRADQAGPARGLPVLARPGGLPGRAALALRDGDWMFPTYRDSMALVARGLDPVEVADPAARRLALRLRPDGDPHRSSVHAAGHPAAARRRPRLRRDGARAGHRRAGLHRRRRHQRGRLPRGPQLRRRVQRARGVPRPEQPVRHQRPAGQADRRARPGVQGRRLRHPRPNRSTATTPWPCSRCSTEAVEHARSGHGPCLVEAHTYRIDAHTNADDATRYRDADEVDAGSTATRSPAWRRTCADRGPLDDAAAAADRRRRPRRSPPTLRDRHERRPRSTRCPVRPRLRHSRRRSCASRPRAGAELDAEEAEPTTAHRRVRQPVTMAQALNRALRDAMAADDDRVVVFGEDVGTLGGVFRVTDGLAARLRRRPLLRHPAGRGRHRRLRRRHGDGRAPARHRDAVRRVRLPGVRADRLATSPSCATAPGARSTLPIVIRVPYAGGIGGVEHHSDSSEAYYAHTPGLKVVTPATVEDAYSLLREAIDDPDPVVFLEPKRLYWSKEVRRASPAARRDRSAARWCAGAGTRRDAGRLRPDRSPVALEAADGGRGGGLGPRGRRPAHASCPSTTRRWSPSVRKTGRCVVVHEAQGFAGVGAEIAARVQERCFHSLRRAGAAGRRLGHPVPAAEARAPPPARRRPRPRRDRPAAVGRRPDPASWPARRRWRVSVSVTSARRPDFLLPDLGEGLTEAESWSGTSPWATSAGRPDRRDVETAKATVDVPCPYAGRVAHPARRSRRGARVGRPLLTIGTDGPALEGSPALRRTLSALRRSPARAASSSAYGTSETRRSRRDRRVAGGRPPAAAAAPGRVATVAAPDRRQPDASPTCRRAARSSRPVVRKLASDNGVDLAGAGADRALAMSSAGPTSRPPCGRRGQSQSHEVTPAKRRGRARTGLATYGSRCVACGGRSPRS